ncbi:hypothetical protein DPMN_062649 [Dreissena polymorpha]|uniref:Uncharacterized protein n=1 Tax=Dreissena polymorpha TaxID=45954 RepID=A0A9D4C9Z7_DREPO|nr:hypothetical protein DPMN_062649 [Dreissena polymorpha]
MSMDNFLLQDSKDSHIELRGLISLGTSGGRFVPSWVRGYPAEHAVACAGRLSGRYRRRRTQANRPDVREHGYRALVQRETDHGPPSGGDQHDEPRGTDKELGRRSGSQRG